MKTAILKASVEFIEQPFLKPMQISSGLIGQATEARVTVSVSTGKKEGVGRGSIYLSDLWAWPGGALDRRAKDAAMRGLCRELASSLARHCGSEEMHPLELGLRLHHAANGLLPEMPPLAKSVCMSPFDAAIHDAAGIALGKSAFSFYAGNEVIPSADSLFPGTGAVRAIRQTVRSPVRTLDAWWIVGANDNLENDVRPAVAKRGIRCFKLKALGRDNLADAARTAEVYRAARGWGLSPVLSIDTNEGSPDVAAVWDYLARLEAMDPEAYAAVAYLEQPTSRDLVGSPQDWRALGGRKPVLLDEGLTSLDLLPLVKTQGWSGLALKTCKGHSFTLVAAAWARQNGLQLSLQDLTNPGYSAIHSFLLGAHLSTLNGVELNSPQFTSAANAPWLPALTALFDPQHGVHRLEASDIPGLGSSFVQVP